MSTRDNRSIGGQRGGEAALRSEKVSAAQIQMYLKGMDYPADKQEVIDQAESNNAPENVMNYFNKMPDKTFNSPVEIEREFSKLKSSM